MEAGKIRVKTLLITVLTIAVIELATALIIPSSGDGLMTALAVVRGLEISVILVLFSIFGEGPSSLGLEPSTIIRGLERGLSWSAVFGVGTLFAFALLFLLGIDPIRLVCTRLPEQPARMLMFFVTGGLVGPIAEEMFFRGVLYGFFRRWGIPVALIVSSAVFVLAHPVLPGIPITQAVGAVVFALSYEAAGSLLAPITIHVLGNTALFTLSALAR